MYAEIESSRWDSSSPSNVAATSVDSALRHIRRKIVEAANAEKKAAELALRKQKEARLANELRARKEAHFQDREAAWRNARGASEQLAAQVAAAAVITPWIHQA